MVTGFLAYNPKYIFVHDNHQLKIIWRTNNRYFAFDFVKTKRISANRYYYLKSNCEVIER